MNGMGILPDGTAYAVFTTLQYFGYKPTANCTLATVVPQAAYATALTKTPEQMQQEAQDSGCLRIWHEFSWWFPWYRVHFVSVCDEIDLYDQGISPLPLVEATLTCSDTFLNIVRDLWNYAVWPVAATVAGAEFFALIASNGGPIGFLAAVIASTGIKILSYINNFNSINGLAGAFIGCIFSTVIGMLKWTWSFVADVIRVVMGVMKLAEFGFGNIYRIFSFCASLAYGTAILARLRDLGAVHI